MLLHGWWDYKLIQPLWKSIWRFFKELEIMGSSFIHLISTEVSQKDKEHYSILTHIYGI